MITANVFRRTFFIKFGQSTGTAFTVDCDGRQYLITARHVVDGIANGATIGIRRHGQWHDKSVQVVGYGDPARLEEDVAVLALPDQISPSFQMEPTSSGLIWGQDVFFLGFPYGLATEKAPNEGYPLPLIKRALMSGTTNENLEVFLLDGHNNPGFSGGPAVFKPATTNSNEFRVFGIVSAYRQEHTPITFQGKQTGLTSSTNTGIVICPSIKRATDFIEANPIGATITY